MSNEAKCSECGAVVSYETGFTMTGGLGDNSEDRIYCPSCGGPDQGKGYTLSDLQQMRIEGQVARAAYEIAKMEQVGPDVYLAVKNGLPYIIGEDFTVLPRSNDDTANPT